MPPFFSTVPSPFGLTQVMLLGFAAALVLGIVLAFGLLARGGRAPDLARAIYCYLLQGIGAVLMTISGLPAIYGVLLDRELPRNGYLGLLILFLIGGLLFLRFDGKAREIDARAREIPALVFHFTFKLIAVFTTLAACTQFVIMVLFGSFPFPLRAWASPLILLLYGLFLLWATHEAKSPRPAPFRSTQVKSVLPKKKHGKRASKR